MKGMGTRRKDWLISYLRAHWESIWESYKLGLLNNIEILFSVFLKNSNYIILWLYFNLNDIDLTPHLIDHVRNVT